MSVKTHFQSSEDATIVDVAATITNDTVAYVQMLDAQLLQRDRAAECVIVFAKSRRLELGDNIYRHYRSIFNHCDIIGLRICRIR